MLSKSGIFSYFFVGLIILTVSVRFYEYFIEKNIVLSAYTSCDPIREKCFIASKEDAYYDFQTEPYKKIEVTDRFAPICLEEHTCENFSCDNIESCNIMYCSEDTLEKGESCVNDFVSGTSESTGMVHDQ